MASSSARAVGAARSGQIDAAEQALARVEEIAAELSSDVNVWARNTAEVLRLEAAAWLALAKADGQAALRLMRAAADVEDETDKSSVSPGHVLPVHEQLADLLMELDRPTEALREYEISFEHAGQRFNSNYGAAKAARAAGQPEVARHYYRQLLQLTAKDSARAELDEARAFLGQ